jgi:hypothetical protein
MAWALLISLASLALGIYNVVHGVRIDTARIRSDVMTRLYGVQVGYEQFLRRIRELKNWPPKPLPDELEWLIASEQAYIGFLKNTAQYRRQTLLGPKRISRMDLYKLQHHVDAMAQRIEGDNKRLDDLLAKYPTGM